MSQIGADTARLRASAQLMRATADQIVDRSGAMVREMDLLAAGWTGIARDRCGIIWGSVAPNFQIAAELLNVYAAQLEVYADTLEAEQRRRDGGGGIFGFAKKAWNAAADGLAVVGELAGDVAKLAAIFPVGGVAALGAALQLPARLRDGGWRGALGGLAGVFGEQIGLGKTFVEGLAAQGVHVPEGRVSPAGYRYGVESSLFQPEGSAWSDPDLMTIGADGRVEVGRISASGAFGNELIGGSGSATLSGPSAEGRAVLSWDPANPYAIAEGHVSAGSATVNGALHTPVGSAAGSAVAEGPSAHARIGVTPGQVDGLIGASAGSARADASAEFLGQRWGAGVEVGAKVELGFSVGERVALDLPFISVEASGPVAGAIPGLRDLSQVGERVGAAVAAGETLVDVGKDIKGALEKLF